MRRRESQQIDRLLQWRSKLVAEMHLADDHRLKLKHALGVVEALLRSWDLSRDAVLLDAHMDEVGSAVGQALLDSNLPEPVLSEDGQHDRR
jgi:hypothetical protein